MHLPILLSGLLFHLLCHPCSCAEAQIAIDAQPCRIVQQGLDNGSSIVVQAQQWTAPCPCSPEERRKEAMQSLSVPSSAAVSAIFGDTKSKVRDFVLVMLYKANIASVHHV